MVIVPATTGQLGVLPGHVATIAELKPGVLSVHEGNDVTKYFVGSAFAFVHANSYAHCNKKKSFATEHFRGPVHHGDTNSESNYCCRQIKECPTRCYLKCAVHRHNHHYRSSHNHRAGERKSLACNRHNLESGDS